MPVSMNKQVMMTSMDFMVDWGCVTEDGCERKGEV